MFADMSMTKPSAIPITALPPAQKWEDLPEDFECPVCGVGKEQFSKED